MQFGEEGKKLGEMIKKAIDDGQVTNSEYSKILALADQDFLLDPQEKQLLRELQALLANKTERRRAEFPTLLLSTRSA